MSVFSVYMISNDVNSKVYIGQTTKPISERFKEHCSCPSEVGKAIREIGKNHFSVSLLDDSAKNLDELAEKERFYIKKYNSFKNGYNKDGGGKSNGKIASESKMVKVTTTLPPELFQQIKVQAAKEGRTLSEILECLISSYLKEKNGSWPQHPKYLGCCFLKIVFPKLSYEVLCAPAVIAHSFNLSISVQIPHCVFVLVGRIWAEYVASAMVKINHKSVFL